MSLLVLMPRQRLAIEKHAAAAYPEECCGVLVGRPLESGDGHVVGKLLPVDNQRQDSRGNRYLIAPETVLAAEREARRAGSAIVGYYHSHPDCPARPSDFDLEHAWPGLSYVICSLEGGAPAELRSWRLADERDRFCEEELSHDVPVPAGTRRAAQEGAR